LAVALREDFVHAKDGDDESALRRRAEDLVARIEAHEAAENALVRDAFARVGRQSVGRTR
jgi:hypothetical protein